MLQEVAILVEWVLRVPIHLILFLHSLLWLVGDEKLVDLLECIPSYFPFRVENLIGKALVNCHLFKVLISSIEIGIVVADTDGRSTLIGVWILVIYISQLITFSFMELMNWDVIKVGEQSSSLFNFLQFVGLGKVNVLPLVRNLRQLCLLNLRWLLSLVISHLILVHIF